MKMLANAWRDELAEKYKYKIQINDIKHGDKLLFTKLFKEWGLFAEGWNTANSSQMRIVTKDFKNEKEWVEWAKKCPVKIVEIKYRSGKQIEIDRFKKPRKKRVTKCKI